MTNYKIAIQNVSHSYERRLIFRNISSQLVSSNIYGIIGSNGSGKSTFAKILARIITPAIGNVIHFFNNINITEKECNNKLGFVAPYLILYEELTANENLKYLSQIRDNKYDIERANYLLNELGIYNRRDDFVKNYSSGMKQRLKYVFALLHTPNLLILDEPSANLDYEGKNSIYRIIKEISNKTLVIIASNEDTDIELCSVTINIEEYKK